MGGVGQCETGARVREQIMEISGSPLIKQSVERRLAHSMGISMPRLNTFPVMLARWRPWAMAEQLQGKEKPAEWDVVQSVR
jgi:hypothetical protein